MAETNIGKLIGERSTRAGNFLLLRRARRRRKGENMKGGWKFRKNDIRRERKWFSHKHTWHSALGAAEKREGGWVTRHVELQPGVGARYFAVGTHRGHISLDLAKQSGHLNFKYGVYDLTPRCLCSRRIILLGWPATDSTRLCSRISSRNNLPFFTSVFLSLESGNFHRGNSVFFADTLVLYLFPRDLSSGFFGSSCGWWSQMSGYFEGCETGCGPICRIIRGEMWVCSESRWGIVYSLSTRGV